MAEPVESVDPPRCTVCGGLIRPDVVWFGEALPDRAWQQSVDAVVGADVGPQTIEAGHGEWRAGRVPSRERGRGERSVLSSAVWTAADTYVLTVREADGPLVLTATATVTDGEVTVAPSFHVSFGPTTLPTLTGRPTAP